jgi:pimeloyl-ACP methyl ester carboxylesterase
VRQGDAGWVDDVLALTRSWGFELGSIGVPVRLWQGELDRLVPRAHAEYLARKIPGAELEVVPGAGHRLDDHHAAIMRWLVAG